MRAADCYGAALAAGISWNMLLSKWRLREIQENVRASYAHREKQSQVERIQPLAVYLVLIHVHTNHLMLHWRDLELGLDN